MTGLLCHLRLNLFCGGFGTFPIPVQFIVPTASQFTTGPPPALSVTHLKTIRTAPRNELVSARRNELLAGSFGGLPNSFVRIVGTNDGEKSLSLAGLPSFLARADGGKIRIVI